MSPAAVQKSGAGSMAGNFSHAEDRKHRYRISSTSAKLNRNSKAKIGDGCNVLSIRAYLRGKCQKSIAVC